VTKCVRIITEKKNVGMSGTHATAKKMHHALHTAGVIFGAVSVLVVNNSRANAVGVTVGVKEEH